MCKGAWCLVNTFVESDTDLQQLVWESNLSLAIVDGNANAASPAKASVQKKIVIFFVFC